MELSPLALRDWKMSALTFRNRRSIIGRALSGRITWRCFNAAGRNSTSGICGEIAFSIPKPGGLMEISRWYNHRFNGEVELAPEGPR
jgi:hypothetical protein